jgi:PH (Pleckstrin Homology) domain-containing protein
MIPASELMLDGARPIDLTAELEYKPKWRTNGTGLPNYKAGWFRLQNGQKALLFVGDPRQVVLRIGLHGSAIPRVTPQTARSEARTADT